LNRLSRAHERYRQTTDRQTTDGRATANSGREREFTFANKNSSGDEIANVNFYAVRPEASRIR